MQRPSDEIKSRLDIVDLIREYVPLKPAGVNFRARCPFHQEKEPSFIVSPEKQIWHCFGCNRGGDIFSFMMEMEGIEFVEALRLLASKAGVTLRRQDPKLTSQRNRLLDIVDLAKKYYHRMLLEDETAEAIRKYLAKRGLADETIEEWQIGYSPDSWDSAFNFLKGKGYAENEIFLAGMIVNRRAAANNASGFYDRFRGRLMFPINDVNGNTVAFTARVSPEKEAEEKLGKYINSPQTMIYDKSRILFGLDKAKQETKRQDLAIIVEGQMDAITAHQNGFQNVVASSSTALTGEHVKLVKRYTSNLSLAFDMDEAGAMAVDRGIREAMRAEMNIKVIALPEGKDPDECIRRNPDGWKKAVAGAKPIMRYYFDRTFTGLDLAEVENRRRSVKILLPTIAKLGDKVEQDFWLKKLSETIDIAENILRETLVAIVRPTRNFRANNEPVADQGEKENKKASREERLSELLLALILKFPSLLEYAINHIQIDQIVGPENQALYRSLIFYYNNINSRAGNVEREPGLLVSYNDFRKWLENESNNYDLEKDQSKILDRVVLLGDRDFFDLNIGQAKDEAIKMIVILRKNYLTNRMREIEKMIAQAEKDVLAGSAQGETMISELMAEFKALSDEIREMEIG